MYPVPTSVIDAAGIDPDTGAMCLTIREDRQWDMDHLFQLQDKINACLGFIQSGQVFATYPEAADFDLLIRVACKYRPSRDAQEFLDQATAIIEDAGILFRYGPASASYAET